MIDWLSLGEISILCTFLVIFTIKYWDNWKLCTAVLVISDINV